MGVDHGVDEPSFFGDGVRPIDLLIEMMHHYKARAGMISRPVRFVSKGLSSEQG